MIRYRMLLAVFLVASVSTQIYCFVSDEDFNEDEVDALKQILSSSHNEKKGFKEKAGMTDEEFDTLDEMLSMIEDRKMAEEKKRKVEVARENTRKAFEEALENKGKEKREPFRHSGKIYLLFTTLDK